MMAGKTDAAVHEWNVQIWWAVITITNIETEEAAAFPCKKGLLLTGRIPGVRREGHITARVLSSGIGLPCRDGKNI